MIEKSNFTFAALFFSFLKMIFLYVLLFKKNFLINSDFEIFFSHHLSDELKYGKTVYFGENITTKTKQVLDLASVFGIKYMTFSELVSNFNYK